MHRWSTAAILCSVLALHNAQRLAPVPLFDELISRLETDYVGVGNLFGAHLLAYAILTIPAGIVSDRIDNKKLMAAGAALGLVGSALFATSVSYTIAIGSRLWLGMASALLYVPAVRYIVAMFPKERRGSMMGFAEVGAGIGSIFSLTLIPLLARAFDLVQAFLSVPVLAALVLVCLIVGLPSAPPKVGKATRSKLIPLVRSGRFWCLIIFHFLGMLTTYAILGWFPTFLRGDFGFSAVQAGLASAGVTAALAVGSPFAGILSDRLAGRTSVLFLGSALSLVGLTVFLVSGDAVVVVGAAVLVGLSMAFTIPVLMVVVGETFALAGAGLAVSIAGTAGQISSSLSGPLFGYALEAWGTFASVWGLALICAAGRIPFLLGARDEKIRTEVPS